MLNSLNFCKWIWKDTYLNHNYQLINSPLQYWDALMGGEFLFKETRDFLFCVFWHRHSLSMVYTKRKICRNIFCQSDFAIIGMLLLNWYSIHCDWVRYFWLKWLKGKDWISMIEVMWFGEIWKRVYIYKNTLKRVVSDKCPKFSSFYGVFWYVQLTQYTVICVRVRALSMHTYLVLCLIETVQDLNS